MHGAVVGEQLGGHGAHRGRGRHRQRGVHVLTTRAAAPLSGGGGRAGRRGGLVGRGACRPAPGALAPAAGSPRRPGRAAALGLGGLRRGRRWCGAASRGSRCRRGRRAGVPRARPLPARCCRRPGPPVRRRPVAAGVVGEELAPLRARRCRGPSGTAGGSRRPTTRWRRSPSAVPASTRDRLFPSRGASSPQAPSPARQVTRPGVLPGADRAGWRHPAQAAGCRRGSSGRTCGTGHRGEPRPRARGRRRAGRAGRDGRAGRARPGGVAAAVAGWSPRGSTCRPRGRPGRPGGGPGAAGRLGPLAAVDVLVSAAGVMSARTAKTLRTHDPEWRRVLGTNLDGAFAVTSAFVPGMADRRWGGWSTCRPASAGCPGRAPPAGWRRTGCRRRR